ncbi:MAG: D-sedoheptulose 7-phosphate isomerase [Frankiaceae bacterium]|jgi:D-sedoheptulose 7-phosphate isomerase|nr:D-sedoheptulose 7-phosphate isomerase [Frankiaceae bacterium]
MTVQSHVDDLVTQLRRLDTAALDRWGRELARVVMGGGRLLVCGNGGSAAQAQHLAAELVGRYRSDRPAYSAIALCAETSSMTAIGNDYGFELVFSRQVEAHGRRGDILLALSTSGRSPNVVAAAEAARRLGLTTWAFTGAGPNPLADACDDAVCVDAPLTCTVQEVHQVALHLLCDAMDDVVLRTIDLTTLEAAAS